MAMVHKYNVGDKVRMVSERHWWWNRDGLMDKYCGQVMTIKDIEDDGTHIPTYKMVEDKDENEGFGWTWDESDIAELVESASKPATEVKEDKKPEKPAKKSIRDLGLFETFQFCDEMSTAHTTATVELLKIAKKFGLDEIAVLNHFSKAFVTALADPVFTEKVIPNAIKELDEKED